MKHQELSSVNVIQSNYLKLLGRISCDGYLMQGMKPKKDHKVYTQTANNVKKINIKPKLSRGGIGL